MKDILKIGSAFIGIIVGAGFASGQEVLQYFTSFGIMGIFSAIISAALFAYCGMVLVWLGSKTGTNSHKSVIYQLSGRIVGTIIDYILILTLFGIGVVMIAGAGSNLHQQFGLPYFVGTLIMTLLVFFVGLFNTDRVVAVISSLTPFLVLFVIIVAIYCIFTLETSFATLNNIAKETPTSLPNWFISGINYASFNIAVGASMAIVMGGSEKNQKTAALGGLIGGLGVGGLIILIHFALFTKIESVAALDLPLLGIVNSISPVLGFIMSIVIFGMIFSTAMGMFYGFVARFVETDTPKFRAVLAGVMIISFGLSFIGFTDLIAYFYPLIGYLGLVLIVVLFIAPIKMKKNHQMNSEINHDHKNKLAK
jgi:uncharacterized membrane protein YkvI